MESTKAERVQSRQERRMASLSPFAKAELQKRDAEIERLRELLSPPPREGGKPGIYLSGWGGSEATMVRAPDNVRVLVFLPAGRKQCAQFTISVKEGTQCAMDDRWCLDINCADDSIALLPCASNTLQIVTARK